jgi:hypothetical protein
MRTTKYFEEQVLRKRPYIKEEWCQQVIANPIKKTVQSNGRIRYWAAIAEMQERFLRVITLEDGQTVHNAFFDRNFKVDKI